MAVLKANHLATAKAVAKKAQTIMRQADADGSGTLTSDEFLVVAKKFPNLVSNSCTAKKFRVGATRVSCCWFSLTLSTRLLLGFIFCIKKSAPRPSRKAQQQMANPVLPHEVCA